MAFAIKTFADLQKLIDMARDSHLVEISVGDVKVSCLPSSWRIPEKPAAAAPARQPTKEDAERARARGAPPRSTLPTDPMEARLGLVPTPRDS